MILLFFAIKGECDRFFPGYSTVLLSPFFKINDAFFDAKKSTIAAKSGGVPSV